MTTAEIEAEHKRVQEENTRYEEAKNTAYRYYRFGGERFGAGDPACSEDQVTRAGADVIFYDCFLEEPKPPLQEWREEQDRLRAALGR